MRVEDLVPLFLHDLARQNRFENGVFFVRVLSFGKLRLGGGSKRLDSNGCLFWFIGILLQ